MVNAARAALERNDVALVLPYVHSEGETEVRNAFDLVMQARSQGELAREISDRWFFETVVRIHRHGENAPFTGLKPAGLNVGPVIPLAERAGRELNGDELAEFMAQALREQIHHRVEELSVLSRERGASIEAERRYVEALLGLQVYSHRLYRQMLATTVH